MATDEIFQQTWIESDTTVTVATCLPETPFTIVSHYKRNTNSMTKNMASTPVKDDTANEAIASIPIVTPPREEQEPTARRIDESYDSDDEYDRWVMENYPNASNRMDIDNDGEGDGEDSDLDSTTYSAYVDDLEESRAKHKEYLSNLEARKKLYEQRMIVAKKESERLDEQAKETKRRLEQINECNDDHLRNLKEGIQNLKQHAENYMKAADEYIEHVKFDLATTRSDRMCRECLWFDEVTPLERPMKKQRC